MRIRSLLALICVLTFATFPAVPQTSGTSLSMVARWDNNGYIQGTVTLSKMNVSGPDTVIAAQTLYKGKANVTVTLAANSVYNVTLAETNGTQLVKFPITTALINPANLTDAQIQLVCHVADNSLASAKMNVQMNF